VRMEAHNRACELARPNAQEAPSPFQGGGVALHHVHEGLGDALWSKGGGMLRNKGEEQ
jgi:hypothetical protein